MPSIFERKDLKQVRPQISRTSGQGDVIYTFPESSGLDGHEGLDTAVRHGYVIQVLSQVIVIFTWPFPESSKLQEHTELDSKTMLSGWPSLHTATVPIHSENIRMISLSSRPCLPDQPLGAHSSNAREYRNVFTWRWNAQATVRSDRDLIGCVKPSQCES